MTGLIVGGAGVVSIGIGAYFGVRALAKRSDSDKECPGERCTARGVSLNDEAISSAWISNVGLGLGIVGVAAGTYLFLTAGSETHAASAARRTSGVRMRVLPAAE